jgi:hypothetical protein
MACGMRAADPECAQFGQTDLSPDARTAPRRQIKLIQLKLRLIDK